MDRDQAETFSSLIDYLDRKVALSSSHVLDIGCGSGGISMALSQHCERLTVTDISQDAVRDTVENTDCPTAGSQIDAASLPFRSDTFDIAVLNGVLEWVPDAHGDNPRTVQLDTLREINRVLKPGGLLYLGIESRFYIKYLIGLTDHSGLRFAAPLPRVVANVYSQVVRGKGYRNYLYSYRGYKRLLTASGYSSVTVAAALPSYKTPQRIVALADFEAVRTALDTLDEPKWHNRIRKALALHPELFSLVGTELVLTARAGP